MSRLDDLFAKKFGKEGVHLSSNVTRQELKEVLSELAGEKPATANKPAAPGTSHRIG